MKHLVRAEYIALFLFALFVYFGIFGYSWTLLAILLFAPDLSMIGYMFGNKVGAYTYNAVHNLALPVLLFAFGYHLSLEMMTLAALILFIHIFMDRSLGYGLKLISGFKDTHMGSMR